MPSNLIVQAPGGWNFFQQNIEKTLVEELHIGAPDLLESEMERIVGRTPVLTGALMLDTSGKAYTNPSGNLLVELYPADENQLDEYNRIYAQFVEGGILGVASKTIAHPSEMYAKVTTDDLPDIEEWGYKQLHRGLGRISIGGGLP